MNSGEGDSDHFPEPDRIPIDLWTLPGAFLRYGPQLERLMELYP